MTIPKGMVMVRDHFDLGPTITYTLTNETEEHGTHDEKGFARWGYYAFLVPVAVWDEYERLEHRIGEVKAIFHARMAPLPNYKTKGNR